jgi:diadenosine tetraphosphatase ApaH/serine/threonine PP2A family protein phosphatase
VIATWPDVLRLEYQDAPTILISHGSPRNKWESIYPTLSDEEIEAILASVDENVVITGHTHLTLDRKVDRWHIFNPGSVGVPLDGLVAASYVLLKKKEDGWQALFRRVPFDVKPLLREFEHQGFVETCGVIGALLFETFKTARHQGGFLRWRKEHYPDVHLSQDILNEYLNSCQWWEYAHPAYRVNM